MCEFIPKKKGWVENSPGPYVTASSVALFLPKLVPVSVTSWPPSMSADRVWLPVKFVIAGIPYLVVGVVEICEAGVVRVNQCFSRHRRERYRIELEIE